MNLVRPVQQLAEVAEAYRKGDRHRRARAEGTDEVAEVARSFNLLLDTLERKEAEEKRLFSDIAHDLRTPLTVLQGDLEAMEDGLLPCTPENLRRLQEEVRFLARLVEDIRLLTQVEEGAVQLSPKVLDLGALAQKKCWTDFVFRRRPRGCSSPWRWNLSGCWQMRGRFPVSCRTSWTTRCAIPHRREGWKWCWEGREAGPGWRCGTRGRGCALGKRRRCSSGFTGETPPAPGGEAAWGYP